MLTHYRALTIPLQGTPGSLCWSSRGSIMVSFEGLYVLSCELGEHGNDISRDRIFRRLQIDDSFMLLFRDFVLSENTINKHQAFSVSGHATFYHLVILD
jgi:hypothetical protein